MSEELSKIYIKEVFIRHRVLTKIISNRDRKFILKFWETFIAEQGIQVAILIVYYLQTDR
jgi:hypothetical protein